MAQRLRPQAPDGKQNLRRDDRKLLGRHGDPEDVIIERAEGSLVHDARGRTFIDFQMGWCVGNLGWNNPEIVAPLRNFAGPTYASPHYIYPRAIELARRLVDITPPGLARVYRAVGGTEAIELALQLAMKFTGRDKLVSLEGAYHGNSFGALSIGDHARVRQRLSGCKRIAPPLEAAALDRLETLLRRRDVAAFVLEPVVMNLGVLIPEPEFLQGAAELCERYGTLLVADEVACGFGRTGRMFACERYELAPDILCLAKAVTAGYAPLGATLVTAEIARGVRDDFEFYSTYGWHPLGIEAALATLAYFERHREDLFANIAEMSAYFEQRLRAMRWHTELELRIEGLAIGVDLLGDDERASWIVGACHREGLLLGSEGDTLVLFPALTIDRDVARDGLDLLERVVARSP